MARETADAKAATGYRTSVRKPVYPSPVDATPASFGEAKQGSVDAPEPPVS